MGVGYPEDLIICASLGVDMFDCVFPTRTARFGTAFTKYGKIKLKHSKFKFDFGPIEEGCQCETCMNYTKAYLHNIVTREEVAAHMVTKHNIHFLLTLMRNFQNSIKEGNMDEFVK